ncbi:hypothetical protein IQ274_16075 [Nostoc sp. LEGE 12447]|nr:hypothetical protein [Nostoc sp. LEGE 12447]MBE8999711.1 hypothetical protein [Nostoc sp. LEGE 12447]
MQSTPVNQVCFSIIDYSALLNQNMNQAIAGIKLVPHIVSGTEPYLR